MASCRPAPNNGRVSLTKNEPVTRMRSGRFYLPILPPPQRSVKKRANGLSTAEARSACLILQDRVRAMSGGQPGCDAVPDEAGNLTILCPTDSRIAAGNSSYAFRNRRFLI